ncbi:26S proteasome regulatory subunit T4 [Angomonas deanei]|nr:26S proteasome regulatory subunit T4 [Angomonas deanei]|eukprot:EPY25368.1 26S proteasome regulatory subunit T4 [Angomonas deanei]
MQTQAPIDPERAALVEEVKKHTLTRNQLQNSVVQLRRDVRAKEAELDKTTEQIKMFLSIGHYIGEVLRRIDDEKYIVKSGSGARHLVGYKKSIDPKKLKFGTRVALEITTLTIIKVLPREVNPQVYSMQYLGNEGNHISFQEIGGLQTQMRNMREVIELPLTNPELFARVGIAAPKGVLLYGPPGTGKTLLAKAIASNVDAAFLKISASSIVEKYIGESARMIREIFAYAKEHEPCIVFIDEVDAIGGKRIEGSASDREVQRTLLNC